MNVVPNDLLVYPYRGYEVTFRPNTVGSPVEFSQEIELGLEGARRVRLDDADHLSHWILRRNTHEHVNVVNVVVDFKYLDFGIRLFQSSKYFEQVGEHSLIKDLPTVFGRKDYVVLAVVNAVRLFSEFHTSDCIRRRRFRKLSIHHLTDGGFTEEV